MTLTEILSDQINRPETDRLVKFEFRVKNDAEAAVLRKWMRGCIIGVVAGVPPTQALREGPTAPGAGKGVIRG